MDVDDLCTQADLTAEKLVATLKARYENGRVYTNSGLLLLSINPYAPLDIHAPVVAETYRRRVENLQPHIYALVDECLDAVPAYGAQSIVISGESGSGKTETARQMLAYLNVPMVASVETVLEAFGNAWTLNNDNSSRFGKLVRLDGTISVDAFLLEKSRVTSSLAERNFHIFYYLLAERGETVRNDYIDNRLHGDPAVREQHRSAYAAVRTACAVLGLDLGAIEEVLLGILHLGSLAVADGAIADSAALERVAGLLCLEPARLGDYLRNKTLRVGSETIIRPHTDHEARVLRDSIARILYSGLFALVTDTINGFLAKNPIGISKLFILDIFGFESMAENGLDQFCINWCNEKIYDGFVGGTFEHQKQILLSEGVEPRMATAPPARIAMEASCIPLIEKKCGLADLITEESFINGSADNLSTKIAKFLGLKATPGGALPVEHFAGTIEYRLEDFLSKNKERGSVEELYGGAVADGAASALIRSIVGRGRAQPDVIKSFRASLDSLFALLRSTGIHYVKCIKPNASKQPAVFDEALVGAQLRANGVLSAVELSRALYPYAMFIDDFEERYPADICSSLGIVKGRTRYFFNNAAFNILELAAKNTSLVHGQTIKLACARLVAHERERELANKIEETSLEVLANEEDSTAAMEAVIDSYHEEECARDAQKEIAEEIGALAKVFIEDEQPAASVASELSEEDAEPATTDAPANQLSSELHKVSKCSADQHEIAVDDTEIYKQCQSGECQATIALLRGELEKYKRFSVSCSDCLVLKQKYKIQTQQLLAKQAVELELERLKARLRVYEDSDDSSAENVSVYNVFGCLVQLYLDHCPAFSAKDIPKDEMLSLAHAVAFVLGALPRCAAAEHVGACLDEISKRLATFEENISAVCFVLANIIELRVVLAMHYPADLPVLVDPLIACLFSHLCSLQRKSLDDLIPAAILDHQQLKEFRVRESIYKKIFAGPSVARLVESLDRFYNISAYFHLPDVAIMNNLSYLLSYIDFVSFNSLLAKRKFLNLNRCVQINYNLSEIEKFCFNISFHHGFYNMAYMHEATRIATALALKSSPDAAKTASFIRSIFASGSRGSGGAEGSAGKDIPDLLENSLLNAAQVDTIIGLFESPPAAASGEHRGLGKFIDEPRPVVPSFTAHATFIEFVEPKFLPEKSIKSIFKSLKN
ncbi:hypothetical protein PAPHI01_0140 [Pancytospora philotis]|nr:hypothetical protein PAPHI01_0140 [Pancytospora philotis]